MSEEVARELNIGWKCTDCKMFTADDTQSDWIKASQSVPVNVHGVVLPCISSLQNLDLRRLSWAAPRKYVCNSVRVTWMLAVVSSPSLPLMGQSR